MDTVTRQHSKLQNVAHFEKKRLRLLFELVDVDGSRTLSREEFEAVVAASPFMQAHHDHAGISTAVQRALDKVSPRTGPVEQLEFADFVHALSYIDGLLPDFQRRMRKYRLSGRDIDPIVPETIRAPLIRARRVLHVLSTLNAAVGRQEPIVDSDRGSAQAADPPGIVGRNGTPAKKVAAGTKKVHQRSAWTMTEAAVAGPGARAGPGEGDVRGLEGLLAAARAFAPARGDRQRRSAFFQQLVLHLKGALNEVHAKDEAERFRCARQVQGAPGTVRDSLGLRSAPCTHSAPLRAQE